MKIESIAAFNQISNILNMKMTEKIYDAQYLST